MGGWTEKKWSRCSTQSCPRSFSCSMFTIIFKVISFLIFIIIADVQVNHAQGHSHTQYSIHKWIKKDNKNYTHPPKTKFLTLFLLNKSSAFSFPGRSKWSRPWDISWAVLGPTLSHIWQGWKNSFYRRLNIANIIFAKDGDGSIDFKVIKKCLKPWAMSISSFSRSSW